VYYYKGAQRYEQFVFAVFVFVDLLTDRYPQRQSGEAPTGERLRGRGRYGVICM